MPNEQDLVLAGIQAQAEAMARAFDDPAALSRNLAEWISANYSERVSQAYWVTLSGDHREDKGMRVTVQNLQWPWAKRFAMSIGVLLGKDTFGLDVETRLFQQPGIYQILVGVGAVAAYAQPDKWSPCLTFSVKFSL